MTSATLPQHWVLQLEAAKPRSVVVAAPVFPLASPPTVLWLSTTPALPSITTNATSAAQLQSLLTKAGLWKEVAAYPCDSLSVWGADFAIGDADVTLSQPCADPELFGHDIRIRLNAFRGIGDVCDGCPGATIYEPIPDYPDSWNGASFWLSDGSLVTAETAPPPTTTTTAPPTTTTTTAAPAATQPTLGLDWPTSGGGYGSVEPTLISNGGDPSGNIIGITWQTWGGAQATGTGTAVYVDPSTGEVTGPPQTATVVAYDLGTCGGHPAYQAVEWYFPSEGQSFDPSQGITACAFGYLSDGAPST